MYAQWLEGRYLIIIRPLSHVLGTEWACHTNEAKIMAEVKCNRTGSKVAKTNRVDNIFQKGKEKKTFMETYRVLGNMLTAFVFSILSLQPIR